MKLWRTRQLTIEGKIFKTLAISKIVHISLLRDLLSNAIAQLDKMQKEFICRNGNPKQKHVILCNDYRKGGRKNAGILSKVISLQCSWVKKLCDDNFHISKVISFYFIKNYLLQNSHFHSNLSIKCKTVKKFSKFY